MLCGFFVLISEIDGRNLDDTAWVWGPTIKKQGHFVGKFPDYWLKIVNIRSHANWAAVCVSGGHLFLELWYKRAGGRRDGRSWGVLRRWRKKRNWLRTLNLTRKSIIAKITHIQIIFWEKAEKDTCSITEVTALSLPLTPCNLRTEKPMWFWNDWFFSDWKRGWRSSLSSNECLTDSMTLLENITVGEGPQVGTMLINLKMRFPFNPMKHETWNMNHQEYHHQEYHDQEFQAAVQNG